MSTVTDSSHKVLPPSLSRQNSAERLASLQADEAGQNAASGSSHAQQATRDLFNSTRDGAASATNKASALLASGANKGKEGIRTVGAGIVDLREGASSAWSNLTQEVSAASEAGATRSTWARHTPARPTAGQWIAGKIRMPITSSAYILNNAASSPAHGVREGNFRPGVIGTVAAAAAAVWAASLGAAAVAPNYLGWLIKPAPFTAGIASLPNLSAYAFYGSIGAIAVLASVRVAVAVYDKFQESRRAPADAPAAA